MPINRNEITKEMLAKAMRCINAEELIALAEKEGVALTKDEAEAYLAEMADIELEDRDLKNVAGGACWHCLDDCGVDTCPLQGLIVNRARTSIE